MSFANANDNREQHKRKMQRASNHLPPASGSTLVDGLRPEHGSKCSTSSEMTISPLPTQVLPQLKADNTPLDAYLSGSQP